MFLRPHHVPHTRTTRQAGCVSLQGYHIRKITFFVVWQNIANYVIFYASEMTHKDSAVSLVIYLFIYSFFPVILIIQRRMQRWMINWNECRKKRSWPYLSYYCGICVRKTTKASGRIAGLRATIQNRDVPNLEQACYTLDRNLLACLVRSNCWGGDPNTVTHLTQGRKYW